MIGIGSDPPRCLVAVHHRQLNVHQDQVGALLCICGERLLAVCRLDQLVSGVAQQVAQDLPVVFLVLNDKDAPAHASPTCRSTFTGIVNANVEPLPTSDSTQMRPPCISMMRLAIASPSPLPLL